MGSKKDKNEKKSSKPAAPSGLQGKVDGDNLVLSWTNGTDYAIVAIWAISIDGAIAAQAIGLTGSPTTYTYPLNGRSCTYFNYAVCGATDLNGKNVSDITYSEFFIVGAPTKPSLSKEKDSQFATTFKTTVSTSDSNPARGYKWQSVLCANGGHSYSGPTFIEGTTYSLSGERTFTEPGWGSTVYSYTRWYRVAAIGPAGQSEWVEESQIYASPPIASNIKGTYTKLYAGSRIAGSFTNPVSATHPIDEAMVQYQETVPEILLTETSDIVSTRIGPFNSSGSWTDFGNCKGSSNFSFKIDRHIQDDNCMYVRVVNKYDSIEAPSEAVMLTNGLGSIKTPTFTGDVTPGGEGAERRFTMTINRQTSIEDAAIAVHFRTKEDQTRDDIIGILPPMNSTYYAGNTLRLIIPDVLSGENPQTPSFGLQAFIGDYTPVSAQSLTEETYYTISNVQMTSEINWGGGAPPLASDVSLTKINDTTVQVTWDWKWLEATKAEISWADHEDAWYSTDGPQTCTVDSNNISRWNVTGLDLGTYYFRVRLIREVEDVVTYGAYSNPVDITLSESPQIPYLLLQPNTISSEGSTNASWAYESTDGSSQAFAAIYEAFYSYTAVQNPTGVPSINGYYELVDGQYVQSHDTEVAGGKTYYTRNNTITYSSTFLASTNTTQHIVLNAKELGWQPGETHYLALTVSSNSKNAESAFSEPVPINIVETMSASITQHSFDSDGKYYYADDPSILTMPDTLEDGTHPYLAFPDGKHLTISYASSGYILTKLPITMTVKGAGAAGNTTYSIERAETYVMRRPDDKNHYGFDGEVVCVKTVSGEDQVTITIDDLIGDLDDNAKYCIVASAVDIYGQESEVSLTFTVNWAHQAIVPTALLGKDTEEMVCFITPVKPEGWEDGDTADIYRLTADLPELVYKDAKFNTKYVDPYPVYGDHGGYRIVYKTVNGDYITANRQMAIKDYYASDYPTELRHDAFGVVIDFSTDQLILPYNVSLSNTWAKGFTKTVYLGGAVQGDWDPAIERSGSASVTIPIEIEPGQMDTLRRLANYAGICHVRTPDGSSYSADVQVKDDREEKWVRQLGKVSLTITKVDSQGYDGMPYANWV